MVTKPSSQPEDAAASPAPSTSTGQTEATIYTLLAHEEFVYEEWTITHAGTKVPTAKVEEIKAAAKRQEVKLRVKGSDNP